MIHLIGLGLLGAVAIAGFYKKLRDNKVILMLLFPALLLAAFGLLIRSPELQQKGANSADFFISPLIYLLSYGTLRHIYKKQYGVEPTYNRSSWYDPEEGRKQNGFDVLVFILPVFIAAIFPVLITSLLN